MVATLDEMEARAQRHLDGMTVNRDALAKDVLALAKAIRAAQKRATERQKTPFGGMGGSGGFGDIFSELFGGIRK